MCLPKPWVFGSIGYQTEFEISMRELTIIITNKNIKIKNNIFPWICTKLMRYNQLFLPNIKI